MGSKADKGLGFTRSGIKSGSEAAKMHSDLSSVTKGSEFSKLQSAGAKGKAVNAGDAGFKATGVKGGSAAAGWQSSIGNVAKGSTFSKLQGSGAKD